MDFRVTLMLADSAQAVNGKLYILGGGWTVIGPNPVPSAIAVQVLVPWDLTNAKHKMRLELLDTDGKPVTLDTPVGEQPIVIENEFEVGRPPGTKPGTPLDISFAINLGPLQLAPGSRYEWRLSINDVTRDDWNLTFGTREAETPATASGPGEG